MTEFKPTADMAQVLDSQREAAINVRFGKLAQGSINVINLKKGRYQIKKQPVPLSHPLFARAAEALPGLAPALILDAPSEKLTGYIGFVAGTKIEQLGSHLTKAPELIGLAGFKINSLSGITNKLEGGSLHLGLADVPIRLGSAFSGKFTIDVVDESITFSGNAAIAVKGLADGTLDLKRGPDGSVTGKATVGLTLPKNITGSFDVSWDGRVIDGQGKVGYSGEKLSGEIILHLMEKSKAEQLEAESKAPEGKVTPATAAGTKNPPVKIDYVVFGEGNLTFAFNEWLNGNAQVIINPKGYLTIIGKITPQKEFILFEQKDYNKHLFSFEARASYGIPVVGNIFIFATVGMDAFAKLGPGKFYNIVVDGTYSTDPKKTNAFTIRGSLNVSAAAGLRLRAEAGAGLEILSHDIKAGAGIDGIAGIKGYAEAVPIIGYREKGTQGEDKKGEFFIRGELEIAAQPFLGLSGDMFVAIVTPWWSPLSDKRWTWPLFSKEWPIGGSFGIGASLDYVFGSGQLPKLDFKPVDFSADKFMTDMYQDKAKSGSGKEIEKPGQWKEKNSAAADAPSKTSLKGNASAGKLKSTSKPKAKEASKKSGKPATDDAKTADGKSVGDYKKQKAAKGGKKDPAKELTPEVRWERGSNAVKQALAYAEKTGISLKELNSILKSIKRNKEYGFTELRAEDKGDHWTLIGGMSASKPIEDLKKKSGGDDLKPILTQKTGTLGGDTVGKEMKIDWLGEDPKPGTSPESGAQTKLMGLLITDPNQKSPDKYIRGHLLNEHLGGLGNAQNMFPITGNANSQHLHSTEKRIKEWVKPKASKPKRWVLYEVKVEGISSKLDAGPKSWDNYVNSTFSCHAVLKDEEGKVEDEFSSKIPSTFEKREEAEVKNK